MEQPCARAECGQIFTPKTANHIYHSPVCRRKNEFDAKRVPISVGAPPKGGEREAIELLEGSGWIIHRPEPQAEVVEFDTSKIRRRRVRIGIVSDTHIGSKYQQSTLLARFMRYAAEEAEVDLFIHGGDFTDGPFEAHRGAIHEMWTGTYDGQREAAVNTFPKTGIETKVISGNHDEFYLGNAGGDIVRDICDRRDDLTFIGNSVGYVRFGDVLLMVTHPHEGIGYALSYKLQRHIEALAPENKPHILVEGNFHKACHLPGWRNVEAFLLPSFQSQTGWMARKALASIVGGLILEFGVDSKGLAPSLKTEWVIERVPLQHDYPGGERKAA